MHRQKYLSAKAMIGFITFMNMYPPLSTDMYLPALPEIGKYFATSEFLVGLTLTIFFLVFAVSMVLCGPLSDKYGRRPILLFGTVTYTVASLACVLPPNIYVLLVGRFFQGFGSGAVITVSTALIKDCFRGKVMTKILVITQALGVIGPMAAPLVGGVLLRFTDWHGAFWTLTALGIINLILALLLTETLPAEKRFQGKVLSSLSLLASFAKQKSFMMTLIMFALLSLPFMAYLSVSSFVYIENFKLSAQEYSYFFAANASISILGSMMYLRLKKNLLPSKILQLCFAVSIISGLLVLFPGHLNAFAFLLSFLPFTAIGALARPFSMEILLNKAKENVGTASSMINFVPNLFGSIGMALGTLPWGDFIDGLGIIILSATLLSIFMYKLNNTNFLEQGI
mgnify:CR=1 FL=1